MAIRQSTQDFIDHVKGRSKGAVAFDMKANTDGSHTIQKNGVDLHVKVIYLAPGNGSGGGTVTDANPHGDRVLIFPPGSSPILADAQQFIHSLK